MNSDDFEKRLEQQAMRNIPHEWRGEILQTANERRARSDAPCLELKTILSELLWPRPQAWAGLAAIWCLIVALNFMTQDSGPQMASAASASDETAAAMKEQRRLYLELAGFDSPPAAEPPRSSLPKPTSERRKEFAYA